MRLEPLIAAGALALGLAACQPSEDSNDVGLTSGPVTEAPTAEGAATDAADVGSAPNDGAQAEPAQQSAPPSAQAGDMGDAQSREESVEPDSPTMFH